MRWAGLVACVGEMRNSCEILVEDLNGKDNSEYLKIDGEIILEWIFWEEPG
jgi:hypothetical protein